MIEQLPSLSKFVRQLQTLPYLAHKNVYRVADHILRLKEQDFELFMQVLEQVKKNTQLCSVCCAWQEVGRSCLMCDPSKRDLSVICVVETWHDLLALERTQAYKGTYHVLGGALSPLDGIGPEDLTIAQLCQRINPVTKEVILALNQTPEGEATAAYIGRQLEAHHIPLSCLARGVPVGGLLDSMDRLTVGKALSERRPF
jgi:recombination protein RecR